MQFKSLLFALAAVAATASAQTFENNACSQCTFASITKEPTCTSLVPVDMQQLQAIFANSSVNVGALSTAAQNPAIKSCLCHWSNGTLSPTGAAASCTLPQGATPAVCNATQVTIATAQFAPFAGMLQCNATATTTTGGSSTAGNNSSTTTHPTSAAGSLVALNMPYIASVAAFGLAALAGL
ncbi:hypothetical protein BGZ58_011325 [Dissophora ornata]|nr:hypothetical protein BGZ58_011325 [Dissophora ornata]